MDSADLVALLDHLEENIDDLEENLEPLLSAALSASTRKLPVLDKAKLYVLIVYSIESLLFSYLRLNGVQAKSHPVFTELTRVKQYFAKLASAEEGPTKPRENLSLNKQAAARIIKHGLAGNEQYDAERAELQAKQKAGAKRKFEELEDRIEVEDEGRDVPDTDVDMPARDSEESFGRNSPRDLRDTTTEKKTVESDAQPTTIESDPLSGLSKKERKKIRRAEAEAQAKEAQKLKAERKAQHESKAERTKELKKAKQAAHLAKVEYDQKVKQAKQLEKMAAGVEGA